MHPIHSILTKVSTCLLLSAVLVLPALAANGVVDADGGLRLREQPNTEATALSTVPQNTVLEILSTTEDNWHEVTYDGQTGFVSGEYISETDAVAEPLPLHVRVTEGPLNIRAAATTDSRSVKQVSTGTILEVLYTVNGWYRVEGGYISAHYATVADAAEVAAASSQGQSIATFATSLVGSPYVYGGNSPSKGFDCSGLVKYVYDHFDITINRTASAQMSNGTSVSMSELQPGDAVFFLKKGSSASRASHCGIYIGNGQFVHASTPTLGVIISDMDYAYYTSGFVGGRRMG